MRSSYIIFGLFALAPVAFAADMTAQEEAEVIKGQGKKDFAAFLIDTGPGSVSASSMLGISGDAVTNVQNVKGLVLALKGLGNNDSKSSFGIAIAPMRTAIWPVNLQDYIEKGHIRFLTSLTFGYAQATAPVGDKDYQRRAISIEGNYFFKRGEDPVIAHARETEKNEGDCEFRVGDDKADIKAILLERKRRKQSGGAINAAVAASPKNGNAVLDTKFSAADLIKQETACLEQAMKKIPWNASQVSFSLAGGRIKPTTGTGSEQSLGTTAVLGLTWGINVGEEGKDLRRSALAFTMRRTRHDPVLTTLVNATPTFTNTTLTALRYTVGSSSYRALIEASRFNTDEVTASQRVFKRAVGIDYRISEDAWLNVRLGKMRKVGGKDDEAVSLMSVNMSEKAFLKLAPW